MPSSRTAGAAGRPLARCAGHVLRAAGAALLLTGTHAFAQACAPGQWLAEYFPNTALSGPPALQRCENGPIDHYWAGSHGSPDPARLPVDGFSARWTATLPFAGGNARFVTFTDDGVRVFVGGRKVIDNWTEHGITMDTASVPLAAGSHTVRMEYFEAGGEGLAQLVVEEDSAPPPPTPPQFQSFTAQPDTVDAGGTSILAWSVDHAAACTATGGWSGEQAPSGSASVRPQATTTYGLTCHNAQGDTASASATITVRGGPPPAPPAIASFGATPSRVNPGDSARLAWEATGAASCTASGGWSGARPASGEELVRPAASTAYTLTCSNGAGQTASATAQVAVDAANPLPQVGGVNATATPQGVRLGWNAVTQSGKWVYGYYAGWFWRTYPPEAIDMSAMTHFVFGRYAPGAGPLGGQAGELMEGADNAHHEVEDTLIAQAHAAGVKAVMMVGGATDGPGFMAATANPAIRAGFIRQILDTAEQKNYDGVDIDWEEELDSPEGRAQALALLRELRAASQQRPRYQGATPLEISWPAFWVNVNFDEVTAWHVEIAQAVDRFNLMSYGMSGDWGWLSWHHSPLFGEGPLHPTSIASTVQAYLNAGVPRAKLGIGIGLYGLYFNQPVTGPRQSLEGMAGQSNNFDDVNNYQRLVEDNAFGQPGAQYHWDDVAKQSYISYSQPWWRASVAPVTYLSYEDERSIAEKGKWVREQNLGGTLVWAVNYGYLPQQNANPMMQAVKQSFLHASAAGYRVYRDGAAIATVSEGASYTDTAAPSGSHRYQVAMVDAAGNEGPLSEAVTVQVP
jgi:chitinase